MATRRANGTTRGMAVLVLGAGIAGASLAGAGAAFAEEVAPVEQGASPAAAGALQGAPSSASVGGGAPRFALTPEQEEKLRVAREGEARRLLGLPPDAPLPSSSQLTEAQRQTLRTARDAEMRRVLGLGPNEPIPDRATATEEQRQRIARAHEARLREALGLAPDAPLPPSVDASRPASPGAAPSEPVVNGGPR